MMIPAPGTTTLPPPPDSAVSPASQPPPCLAPEEWTPVWLERHLAFATVVRKLADAAATSDRGADARVLAALVGIGGALYMLYSATLDRASGPFMELVGSVYDWCELVAEGLSDETTSSWTGRRRLREHSSLYLIALESQVRAVGASPTVGKRIDALRRALEHLDRALRDV